MICPPCRGDTNELPKHKYCINEWMTDPEDNAVIVKRPEPIRSCACQHKESWNFSVGGKEKNEGNNGDSSQS